MTSHEISQRRSKEFSLLKHSRKTREEFLAEFKKLAKRQRGTRVEPLDGLKKLTLSEILDAESRELGYRDWQHLVQTEHPQNCEDDPFRFPEFAVRKAFGVFLRAMIQQTCSVPNCAARASHVVMLYDFYPEDGRARFFQDLTCPFICKEHLEENERRAFGLRRPRSRVLYPFSNQRREQGHTKYVDIITSWSRLPMISAAREA